MSTFSEMPGIPGAKYEVLLAKFNPYGETDSLHDAKRQWLIEALGSAGIWPASSYEDAEAEHAMPDHIQREHRGRSIGFNVYLDRTKIYVTGLGTEVSDERPATIEDMKIVVENLIQSLIANYESAGRAS